MRFYIRATLSNIWSDIISGARESIFLDSSLSEVSWREKN